jgi:hypothetical protein
MPTHPTAFISYSWDDETHRACVRDLATRLRADGVDVRLDYWHTVPGDQLPEFMEREIRKNDFVIVVCTPKYKTKSEARTGGVGYEGGIMTAEVFAKQNHRKFIPVLARGGWAEAAPSWLSGSRYVDLSDTQLDTKKAMRNYWMRFLEPVRNPRLWDHCRLAISPRQIGRLTLTEKHSKESTT